jgi:long-chain fatty acid transport protein
MYVAAPLNGGRSVSRLRTSTLAAFALVQFGWVGPAFAGAFATARYTGEHGHPVTDNATSIYWNPGAMTRGSGTRGLFDLNIALRRVTYFHQLTPTDDQPPGGEEANAGRAEALNVFGAPTLGMIAKFGDNFAVGGLIHGPFGGMVQFSQSEQWEGNTQFPGAVDGPGRWHSITGAIASVYISGGAAYKFADELSIGLALNLIRSSVETLIARNANGSNDLASEGRAALNVSGWQWSFAAGVMSELVRDQLWFGLSYQAQPNISGGMVLEGKQRTYFQPGSPPNEIDANLHQTYPDIWRAGLAYRPQPLLELRLFGAFERWSVLTDQCVTEADKNCELDDNGATIPGTDSNVVLNARRNFKDTIGVRVGGSFWTDKDRGTEIFGGLGYDGNAVPDETLEPSLPDSERIAGSVGARFALSKSAYLAGSYTHMHYIGRDNIGKSTLTQLGGQSRFPDAGGVYNSWIGIFNANVEYTF